MGKVSCHPPVPCNLNTVLFVCGTCADVPVANASWLMTVLGPAGVSVAYTWINRRYVVLVLHTHFQRLSRAGRRFTMVYAGACWGRGGVSAWGGLLGRGWEGGVSSPPPPPPPPRARASHPIRLVNAT